MEPRVGKTKDDIVVYVNERNSKTNPGTSRRSLSNMAGSNIRQKNEDIIKTKLSARALHAETSQLGTPKKTAKKFQYAFCPQLTAKKVYKKNSDKTVRPPEKPSKSTGKILSKESSTNNVAKPVKYLARAVSTISHRSPRLKRTGRSMTDDFEASSSAHLLRNNTKIISDLERRVESLQSLLLDRLQMLRKHAPERIKREYKFLALVTDDAAKLVVKDECMKRLPDSIPAKSLNDLLQKGGKFLRTFLSEFLTKLSTEEKADYSNELNDLESAESDFCNLLENWLCNLCTVDADTDLTLTPAQLNIEPIDQETQTVKCGVVFNDLQLVELPEKSCEQNKINQKTQTEKHDEESLKLFELCEKFRNIKLPEKSSEHSEISQEAQAKVSLKILEISERFRNAKINKIDQKVQTLKYDEESVELLEMRQKTFVLEKKLRKLNDFHLSEIARFEEVTKKEIAKRDSIINKELFVIKGLEEKILEQENFDKELKEQRDLNANLSQQIEALKKQLHAQSIQVTNELTIRDIQDENVLLKKNNKTLVEKLNSHNLQIKFLEEEIKRLELECKEQRLIKEEYQNHMEQSRIDREKLQIKTEQIEHLKNIIINIEKDAQEYKNILDHKNEIIEKLSDEKGVKVVSNNKLEHSLLKRKLSRTDPNDGRFKLTPTKWLKHNAQKIAGSSMQLLNRDLDANKFECDAEECADNFVNNTRHSLHQRAKSPNSRNIKRVLAEPANTDESYDTATDSMQSRNLNEPLLMQAKHFPGAKKMSLVKTDGYTMLQKQPKVNVIDVESMPSMTEYQNCTINPSDAVIEDTRKHYEDRRRKRNRTITVKKYSR